MEQAVVIKGSRSAFLVKLSKELPFEELVKAVAKKFHDSAGFLGDNETVLGFTGRELSSSEEEILLSTILENCSLKIPYLLDTDKEKEAFFAEYLELKKFKEESLLRNTEEALRKPEPPVEPKKTESQKQMSRRITSLQQEYTGLHDIFYKGTLRSGSELIFEHSIVVLGDVNEGATIASSGNIIVLGVLKGIAVAGKDGDRNAFVIALSMDPTQIRIADLIARAPDEHSGMKEKKGRLFRKDPEKKLKKERGTGYDPKIAFVDSGDIYIESVGKEIYDELNLMH